MFLFFVAWVDTAFGPFWAFQKGWLSWLSGVTDNALYPILFLDCLVGLLSEDAEHPSIFAAQGGNFIARWSFILITIIVLTYLNFRGLDIVGKLAMVICCMSLLPFVVFCIIGSFQVVPSRWLIAPPGGFYGVNWSLLFNTFFWNINFWVRTGIDIITFTFVHNSCYKLICFSSCYNTTLQESAACFAGEVKDPSRDYPLGMALAIGLVFITLFVPILVATGASSRPYTEWTDGYFVDLGRQIGGPWLAYWLMFAAAVSNIGMFEAEMSSDSWQVAGMAERGILPAVLGTRSAHDTPIYGILLSAGGVLCLGWMSFGEVVAMLNLLYCFGQLIEFAAFLHLRAAHPDLPRPFRIPIGTFGMGLLLAMPTVFIGVVVYFSSPLALGLSLLLCALGCGMYYLLVLAKQYNWCEFEERHLHDEYKMDTHFVPEPEL